MSKSVFYIFLLSLFLSSCETTSQTGQVNTLSALSTSSDNILDLPIFNADEAYMEDGRLYVKYRAGRYMIYAFTEEVTDLNKNNILAIKTEEGTVIKVLPLRGHLKSSWQENNQPAFKTKPLTILSVNDWVNFRDTVRKSLLPLDAIYGTVADFLNDEETFIYYDKDGNFKASPIDKKPSHIKVASSYRFDEIIDIAYPILEKFLVEKNIKERKVIFNTGDMGFYSYPFIYLDIENRQAVFTQLVPRGGIVSKKSASLSQTARLTMHFVKSNVLGILSQPVSSMHRLVTILGDTTVTNLKKALRKKINHDKPAPPLSNEKPMNLFKWEKHLNKITNARPSRGTIDYLVDGEEFFPRLIDTMLRAEKNINMRIFIFDNDDYSIKIADILKKRSNVISVKVLLDDIGTVAATGAFPSYIPTGKREVFSMQSYLLEDSKIKLRQTMHSMLGGDHAKTITIDKKIAFLGGMNIGREYRYEWHDMMVEVQGPIAVLLDNEFKASWKGTVGLGDVREMFYRMKKKDSELVKRNRDHYPIRMLKTTVGSFDIHKAYLEAIRNAKSYIYVENPYITDDDIIYELIMARRRGVDVRVILTVEGDSAIINKSNAIAANLLHKNGVRIFIYPGMTHLKAVLIDGWACIGSANLDKLSLKLNEEINLASSHREVAQGLMAKVFIPDFEKSTELTGSFPEKWYDYFLEKLADQM